MNIFVKRSLFIFLLWGNLGLHQVAGNTIDSLFQVLETTPRDTNRVKDIFNLCWQLHRTDIDKVLILANEGLALSEELNYKKGVGNSYSYLSWSYMAKGNYEKSLELAYKSAEIAEEIGDEELYSSSYNDIAGIYSETGKPEEALKIWQEIIDLDKKKGKGTYGGQAMTYLNMAVLLVDNNNNKEARKYFMNAMEAAQDTDQKMVKSAVHVEVAQMYADEGNVAEAESNFLKALEIAEPEDDLWVLAFSTLGLSKINLIKGNKELALAQARNAVQLTEQIGDVSATITAKGDLAKMLRRVGQYEEALQLGFLIAKIAEKNRLVQEQMKAYSELSLTYKELKNYEQAFIFSERFHVLQDSTASIEKSKNLLELEKKYHSELKETENQVLKLRQQEQNLQLKQKSYLNKSLFFILFLLGAVCFMIYKNYCAKITAHQFLEEKVKERTEELRLVNNNLQKSNTELERFAHIASHDLREPLRNISGFAGLLRRELTPEEGSKIEEYLSFITDNTVQLNILIQDILIYSKLNQEKIQEQAIFFDPCVIIDNISKDLSRSFDKKRVKIFVKGEFPKLLSSNKQVYFLFKNLIDNGVKYNKNPFPRIDISCEEKGDNYEFSVRDNGIGISPEFTSKIFEMFTRLHNRKHFKGTGLGLSLCQKIVENHGGTIRVESTKEKGSNFIFTWPKALTSVNNKPNKKEEGNAFVLSSLSS